MLCFLNDLNNYSVPGAYRPISLLHTLGKILEVVIARRLSFWAKTYKLLPDTQSRGRPGHNTEQVLLVLANAINRAWLQSKVVTLIASDLKGAFNGVKKVSLDACLQAKGIPTMAKQWIYSCMENQYPNIIFDNFQTEVFPLENTGLAQSVPINGLHQTLQRKVRDTFNEISSILGGQMVSKVSRVICKTVAS